MLLEVGNQLGEDRLELLEGGGHVDGSAGQVGAGDRYTLAVCGDPGWFVCMQRLFEGSREPVEALESSKQRNGGQNGYLCISYEQLIPPPKETLPAVGGRSGSSERLAARLVQGARLSIIAFAFLMRCGLVG